MKGLEGIIVTILVIAVLKEGFLWRSEGCIEEERAALVELKSSIDTTFCLRDDDCCTWDGVECDSSTGRVTSLYIYPFSFVEEWHFNASLFLPFQHLTTLDFTQLRIIASIRSQGFERLSRLKRLKSLSLDLSHFKDKSILSSISTIPSLRSITLQGWTTDIQGVLRHESVESVSLMGDSFNRSIFSYLSGFSSLKSLSLNAYEFNGTIGTTELSKLGKLENLSLTFDYRGSIPSLAALQSLKSLSLIGWDLKDILDLQDIGVSRNLSALEIGSYGGMMPNTIKLQISTTYRNLKAISLYGFNLENPIFSHEYGKRSIVEELVLDGSSLKEEFFQSLKILPSLKTLSLFNVNATMLGQGFSHLTKLENLELSYTALNNSVLKYIGNISSLKTLRMSHCGLSDSTTLQSLCNLKQLEVLHISANEFSGSLPWCIANLTSLQVFYLSDNHFSGSFSTSPLSSLTSLKDLSFSRNLFRVSVSLESFFNHSKLKFLDGQDNLNVYDHEEQVHGSTPRFQLRYLFLSSSHGSPGGFPQFLSHQHSLELLDLSNNQLKGEFPFWLLQNNTKLRLLNLANTSLSGPFLSTHHLHLGYLDVSKNSLNGTIPRELGQILPSLYLLNLSQNCLVGDIPSSIGKICPLISLDLSSNKLSGEIPEDLGIGCPSLTDLVLSNNDFEGPILPNNAHLKYLDRLQVDNNNFFGNIPNNLVTSTLLTVFDASDNNLSGNVPGWIADMSDLEVLDLSRNRLSGNLPTQLGPSRIREVYLSENKLQGSLGTAFHNSSQLMTLDLSHNKFQGMVPKWVGELPELSFLLLSHNNLEGEIPLQLCSLEQLSLVDLANNKLSGHIPSCIKPGSKYMKTDGSLDPYLASAPSYMEQPLEFTTKSLTFQFQGSILEYISGLDLSCNNFSGPIPLEFGNLTMIQVLNLSHNSFTGPIPDTLSNMVQIESLDLSYNNLDGKIPSQILRLNFISHFNVAHNNLSGETPEMVAQFQTFDNSSYVGNPFLCGPPLTRTCSLTLPPPSPYIVDKDGADEFMDLQVFYITLVISYAIVLLSIGVILYVNPYWRRRWFYMIHVMITNCGYFIEDNIYSLLKRRAS